MKTYTLSSAAAFEHVPVHPERTAYKALDWDIKFQEWPNEASMKKTIELQGRRAPSRHDWTPWVGSNLEFHIRKDKSKKEGRCIGVSALEELRRVVVDNQDGTA